MRRAYDIAAVMTAAILWTSVAAGANDYPCDTAIYLGEGSRGGKALVMLSLDLRPNLGSTVCNGSECDFLKAAGNPEGINYIGSTPTSFLNMLRAVLKKVFHDVASKVPDPEALKIGLMLNHQHVNNCEGPHPFEDSYSNSGCSNGGYITLGFSGFDAIQAGALEQKLAAIPLNIPQNIDHKFQGKELYFELFRYLTGQVVYNGHNGWDDYGVSNLNLNVRTSGVAGHGLSWDSSIESPYLFGLWWHYNSPLEDCAKVFVLNFMFGVSSQDNDSDTDIKRAITSGGMGFDPKNDDKAFSRVIGWLYDRDLADGTISEAGNLDAKQNVTSYFFANSTGMLNKANEYALAGGTGTAIPVLINGGSVQDLYKQILGIFHDILRVSTTFVAAAVPVNVVNRAETRDAVYFALFEPQSEPRWPGNLKRLKLAVDLTPGDNGLPTYALQVLDVNSTEAISSVDGKIRVNALTYWTDPTGRDVTQGVDAEKAEVAGQDGRSVDRGGAGQQIPGFLSDAPSTANGTGRTLLTEPLTLASPPPTIPMAFNADEGTAGSLWLDLRDSLGKGGVASYAALTSTEKAEVIKLLKFARGIDARSEDPDGLSTDARSRPRDLTSAGLAAAWPKQGMMGDLLHSQPVPINYGARTGYTLDNPDIRILVSGNDGFLHLFRNTDGRENWAFIPRATLGILKPLYDNNPSVLHPYGVDGPAAVYVVDGNNDGTINTVGTDQVIVVFGLRRGGSSYYAMDLTDPDSPKILWRISKTTGGEFDQLGLSFARPWISRLKWVSDPEVAPKPVVILGGGYDPDKDAEAGVEAALGTDDNVGNAIYILDLLTGELVWKAVGSGSPSTTTYVHASLTDSIPSQVAAIDTDGDTLVDILYVGDTGGRVWRGDLTGWNRSQWRVYPLLTDGRHASGQPDRRFFHRPDVVRGVDVNGTYIAVVIGSGDRPHPLGTAVTNRMYLIKDRNLTPGLPLTPPSAYVNGDFVDVTSICRGAVCTSTPDAARLAKGWYMDLEREGEKSLSSPLTLYGDIYFSTYSPKGDTDATCTPSEGKAFTYVVNMDNGTAALDLNTSVTGLERSIETGEGIPSDALIINLNPPGPGGPFLYVVPSNLATSPVFRKTMEGRGTVMPKGAERFFKGGLRVFWYDQQL